MVANHFFKYLNYLYDHFKHEIIRITLKKDKYIIINLIYLYERFKHEIIRISYRKDKFISINHMMQ